LDEAQIRFPVVCPICGGDSLASHWLKDIVGALCLAQPIALRSQCHGARWLANQSEIAQLQDYCMVTIFYAMEFGDDPLRVTRPCQPTD
jgi:hypothetical protein